MSLAFGGRKRSHFGLSNCSHLSKALTRAYVPGLYGLLCTSLVEINGFGPTSLGVWIHSFLCFSRHVVWKGERPWLRQVCLWPLVEVEPRAPSKCPNTWRPKLPSVKGKQIVSLGLPHLMRSGRVTLPLNRPLKKISSAKDGTPRFPWRLSHTGTLITVN